MNLKEVIKGVIFLFIPVYAIFSPIVYLHGDILLTTLSNCINKSNFQRESHWNYKNRYFRMRNDF